MAVAVAVMPMRRPRDRVARGEGEKVRRRAGWVGEALVERKALLKGLRKALLKALRVLLCASCMYSPIVSVSAFLRFKIIRSMVA